MRIVELYKFEATIAGIATTYRWTSSGAQVSWNGNVWVPALLERGATRATSEVKQGVITLNCAGDNAIAQLFRGSPPDLPVELTIYRGDLDDLAGTVAGFWRGRVAKATFDGASARMTCAPELAATRRTMPVGRYSRLCRWALYSTPCGVDRVAFTKTGDLIDENEVLREVIIRLAEQLDAGWAKGGYLEFDGLKRFVLESDQGIENVASGMYDHLVTIDRWIPSLEAGATVDLVAGCDHAQSTCDTKFANKWNFGGFPLTPRRNPFFHNGEG